jgi:hypothetical protein
LFRSVALLIEERWMFGIVFYLKFELIRGIWYFDVF